LLTKIYRSLTPFWKGVLYSFSGILLLVCGLLTSFLNYASGKDTHEELLGSVQVPGYFEIDSLPDHFSQEKPFSLLLDTQLVSSHARISKNPFLRTFQYQFYIPLQVTYLRKDDTEITKDISVSSQDPLLLASIEHSTIHGQEFIRIPLFSVRRFDEYQSIKISFGEDPEGFASFFESVLIIREAEESIFLSFYAPFLLIFSGLLIFQLGIFYFLLGFFHRNLAPGEKSYTFALILSGTMGPLGIDRFYLGYPVKGLVKGMTLGGLGVWYFYDLFVIAAGKLPDKSKKELKL
jgi:hypothetical protein